ncbi:glycosyl hydrolase family 28-related protein [Mucilaginibacter sp. SP1R1]|uniref:glycosyl hydrolase family 28-related protein n=1 Tax=Mucilaginibacter sp. SP1R1 TaxID=2723091 RepID=UPI00160A9618|nr:glycosyl hydrolase family 28-related protein [Mucilaginibacter sp. SP1R1]MBB6148313.1 hypothetical protein [Mucilaginibacter sp. SP1R1]
MKGKGLIISLLMLFFTQVALAGYVDRVQGYVDAGMVNVMDHGAKGDGVTDDTRAIRASLVYAKENHQTAVYFPKGTYSIQEPGSKPGIIPLSDGVSLIGAGVKDCHIILSGGRFNPRSIFYQAWWQEHRIDNVMITGIDFDGSISQQTFEASYQYCHALSINNGKNIEVNHCKFENFRGDGLLFGDTFEPLLNARIAENVSIHDNEFINIFREGAMFCCVNGASFYNNYVHGDGYLVGGVDIERHSDKESVLHVSVYNNTFDFRDGYGPVERGRRQIHYRRAITMGYFYAGYKNGVVDSLSGHHQIDNNTIYQGQIDCFGHVNVEISGNMITNYFENISGVSHISLPAINISDARTTTGLGNVSVDHNTINSAIPGNGITFYKYSKVSSRNNTFSGAEADGVHLINSDGKVSANKSVRN